MLDYKIKILENDLLYYEQWIDHVKTCGLFNNPQEIIDNKLLKCFSRMKSQYPHLDFKGLTDEEIVNLIILQEGYQNRDARKKKEEV